MSASRSARPTLTFVDEYCQLYRGLFPEVRSFEAFKFLHLGLIAEIKRKSLPAIARAVGLDDPQSLHHFLTESPWSVVSRCISSGSIGVDFTVTQRAIVDFTD